MTKIEKFRKKWLDETHTKVDWPDTPDERQKVARLFYGADLVGALDYWINLAKNLIENPEPPRPYPTKNYAYRRDRAYRRVLSTLTGEQKRVVLQLVIRIASGMLYSSQVTLDEPSYLDGPFDIRTRAADGNEVRLAPSETELHQQQVEWIDAFSEFAMAIGKAK